MAQVPTDAPAGDRTRNLPISIRLLCPVELLGRCTGGTRGTVLTMPRPAYAILMVISHLRFLNGTDSSPGLSGAVRI